MGFGVLKDISPLGPHPLQTGCQLQLARGWLYLWLDSLHHGSDAADVGLQLLGNHLDEITILDPFVAGANFENIKQQMRSLDV